MAAAAAYWQRHYRLQDAKDDATKHPGTVVIAVDRAKGDGAKLYFVATLFEAFRALMGDPTIDDLDPTTKERLGEYQYELIDDDGLARLFFDADFLVALNACKSPEEALAALYHYANKAYLEIPNRPANELEFATEIAHDPATKFSYHGKSLLRCGVVRDRFAQLAFWNRVKALVIADKESSPMAKALQICTPKHPNGDGGWFWDESVYSRNRLMRTLGACKRPKRPDAPKRYLLLHGGGGKREDITFEEWNNSRIMNVGENPVVLQIPAAWYEGMDAAVIPPRPDDRVYFAQHYPYELMTTYISSLGIRRAARFPDKGSPKYFTADDVPRTADALRRAMTRPLYEGGNVTVYPTSLHMDFFVPGVETIGGRYVVEPTRELVIDLDLKDWTHRNLLCDCGQKAACRACWILIELAALVLGRWLSDTVGLGPMLAVFSGSKGAHLIWASAAARALRLCDRQKLFDLLKSKAHDPTLDGIKHAALDLWVRRGIVDRGLMLRDDLVAFLRKALPANAAAATDPFPPDCTTSLARWQFLTAKHQKLVMNTIWNHFARPVIDAQVTLEKVHLLKTPFSLHATTGKMALPIPLSQLGEVDPATMPTAGNIDGRFQQACETFRAWLVACEYI